jgi:arginase
MNVARQPARRRRYAIVEAPSILGLKPSGVELLPERLLANGFAERIQARRAARVDTPEFDARRDSRTGTLNARAIADWSPRLADAVESVLSAGEFPVVLGGDCSIVLGTALGLCRHGRFGLLFIDGHADFYQPSANPNGEAASMDLAFVTGHGPKLLTDFEGRRPLIRDEDAVVFAFRDAEEQAEYGSQPLPQNLRAFDLDSVRELGIEAASSAAVLHLTRPELDGFFIHVDADCLDDAIMPAVDYRIPGGLSWHELDVVLRTALSSGKAVALEIAIYNPKLDPGGRAGRKLASVLARALGTRAPLAGAESFARARRKLTRH